MKTKKQASKGTAFYIETTANEIRTMVCIWNIWILLRNGASAQLADALIKCSADITAIQKMRLIGQGCKRQADWDIYYSCHAEFGCGFVIGWRLR